MVNLGIFIEKENKTEQQRLVYKFLLEKFLIPIIKKEFFRYIKCFFS